MFREIAKIAFAGKPERHLFRGACEFIKGLHPLGLKKEEKKTLEDFFPLSTPQCIRIVGFYERNWKNTHATKGTYIRWKHRNRCARKEQSLLFDLCKTFV